MTLDSRQMLETIEGIGNAFDDYKRSSDAKLERLETRISRPGAFSGTAPATRDRTSMVFNDQPVMEIRAGDDVTEVYRKAGRLDNAGEFADLSIGDWFRALAGQKSTDLARKAMSIGTDTSGGHLVPSVLMPAILGALVPASSLLQAGARMLTVGSTDSGGKTFTMGAVNAIPTAAWRNEAAAVAESDPTFRTVVGTPRSLAFYFRISRELLADAANLDSALPGIMGQSLAREMDRAGLIGTGGAPEPRGIKNVSGVQSVTNGAAGTALGTIKFSNLLSAYSAILGADAPTPTAAIVHPRTAVGFASLVDSTGQPLQRPDMLRDLRMITSSQVPVNLTVGGSTDCSDAYIGDFTKAIFMVREFFSVQRLDEAFATNGQVGFIAHARLDFALEYPAAFSVVTGIRP
jgi:HK97 family phage major capsid protein